VSAHVIGNHAGCGGEVVYQVEPNMGWRYCERCRASTLRGQEVELAPASKTATAPAEGATRS
jgi:hypothetical protein